MRFLKWLLALWLLGLTPAHLFAQVDQQQTLASKEPAAHYEFLLFDFVYSHRRIDSFVTILQDTAGRKYIPLRHVALSLGYRLQIKAGERKISGFLNSPRDRIAIDAKLGTGSRAGVPFKFDSTICFEQEGDLYVESSVFSQWFHLQLNWRLDRLDVEITSEVPLNIPRESNDEAAESFAMPRVPKPLPIKTISSPYELITLPQLDFRLRKVVGVGGNRTNDTITPSVEGYGDLMYMGAKYQVTTDYFGRPQANLTLSRSDPHNGLLGSFRASRVELGDLVIPPISLIQIGNSGVGISISNANTQGFESAWNREVEGVTSPNSMVELYSAGTCLARTKSSEKGDYKFTGVRCIEGANSFTVVTIDGVGQVSEKNRTMYGTALRLGSGEIRYNAFACKAGDRLFGSDTGGFVRPKSSEFGLELDKGISDSSWLSGLAFQIDRSRYLGLGYNAWVGSLLSKVEAIASDDGSRSVSVGLSKRFGNSALSLVQENSVGQIGDLRGLGTNITSMSQLRFEGFTGKQEPLGYSLSLDRYNGSNPSTVARARASKSIGNLSFTNNLLAYIGSDSRENLGLFQLRHDYGSSAARFELGYGFGSSQYYRLSRLSFDRNFSQGFRLQYGFENERIENRSTLYGAIYKPIGSLAIGCDFRMTSNAVRFGLLISTGIGNMDSGSRYDFRAPNSAVGANIKARLFLDRNMSGKFDAGDELLPDVGIRISGRAAQSLSDKNGICLVGGLHSGQEVSVLVDDDSLADPSWVAENSEVMVLLRSGKTVRVDLPVVATAELNGVVTRKSTDAKTWVGNEARLMDQKGVCAGASLIGLDGDFVFSRVWPGQYEIAIVDAEGKVLAKKPQTVKFGDILKGLVVPLAD